MIAHDASELVFLASAAVDTVVLGLAVSWAARGTPLVRRLAGALLAAAALLVLKGLLLLALGLEIPSGVMHVVWLDLVVALPLAALLLLVLIRRRDGRVRRAASSSRRSGSPAWPRWGPCAALVEPERRRSRPFDPRLPAERAGERPVRIGLLADLQCEEVGPHEREAVERLMARRPDLILLIGTTARPRRSSTSCPSCAGCSVASGRPEASSRFRAILRAWTNCGGSPPAPACGCC